jgi:hypothetical protein
VRERERKREKEIKYIWRERYRDEGYKKEGQQ